MTTGTINTFVGASAGSVITTGGKNTLLGAYTGNSGGLDIRTGSNNIVLSDGDANIRVHIDSTGKMGINTVSPAVTVAITGTDAILIPKGTTLQQPAGVSGYLRFNTDTNQFEGYNGTAWASVGGSAITNDTTTATDLFPSFLNATTGTALSIFTSNAKLLYRPSTGELKADELVAMNGVVLNNATMNTSYTMPSGYNGMSTGPFTVAGGVTFTVPAGSRHVIL